jgi:hypothetical protein
VVETVGLENRCTGNRTGGSNPSPSARSGAREDSDYRGPSLSSGFRQQAPASLTPAKRLKFESLSLRHAVWTAENSRLYFALKSNERYRPAYLIFDKGRILNWTNDCGRGGYGILVQDPA